MLLQKDKYEWSYPPPEQFGDTEDDPDELDEEVEEEEEDADGTKMHSVLEFDQSSEALPPQEETPGTSGQQPLNKQSGDALKSTENIPVKEDGDLAVKKVSKIWHGV